MIINVFLLCYNESVLLPHTINHYKQLIPSCRITIYDNESNDNSVEIARNLGCNIVSWSSNNAVDDHKYIEIKNNCWKCVPEGWVIVADMDEWLYITENDLKNEFNESTSILQTNGLDIIGESNTTDLSDVNLSEIKKYLPNEKISKKICFLREKFTEINYEIGAHNCNPHGHIKFSENIYNIKHMSHLGIPFLVNKMIKRYERSEIMRSQGLATHYTNDIEKIKSDYNYFLSCSSHF